MWGNSLILLICSAPRFGMGMGAIWAAQWSKVLLHSIADCVIFSMLRSLHLQLPFVSHKRHAVEPPFSDYHKCSFSAKMQNQSEFPKGIDLLFLRTIVFKMMMKCFVFAGVMYWSWRNLIPTLNFKIVQCFAFVKSWMSYSDVFCKWKCCCCCPCPCHCRHCCRCRHCYRCRQQTWRNLAKITMCWCCHLRKTSHFYFVTSRITCDGIICTAFTDSRLIQLFL